MKALYTLFKERKSEYLDGEQRVVNSFSMKYHVISENKCAGV